jgi:hypothetical protein
VSKSLEDLLARIRANLISSGNLEAAARTEDLLVATVTAAELTAACERRDEAAAEFHTEALERQVAQARPIEFSIDCTR